MTRVSPAALQNISLIRKKAVTRNPALERRKMTSSARHHYRSEIEPRQTAKISQNISQDEFKSKKTETSTQTAERLTHLSDRPRECLLSSEHCSLSSDRPGCGLQVSSATHSGVYAIMSPWE